MEPRNSATVGDRTTNLVEGIAVSPDEEVLIRPPKDAVPVYIVHETAWRSQRTEPNENVTGAADSKVTSNGEANIAFATISRLGGGAALGAVVGTWIFPGVGSLAGAALGGAVGAYAPSILLRVRRDTKRNGGGKTPPK